MSKVLKPQVCAPQEFLEIATDFANPLDLVREAISNAYDAKARNIGITFRVEHRHGERLSVIELWDDGSGMDDEGLQAFSNLGDPYRRIQKGGGAALIGEKGHGTKIYWNSRRVQVETAAEGTGRVLVAVMDIPFACLNEGRIPDVEVDERPTQGDFVGTRVVIEGYDNNRRDLFTHDRLKDHIQWFTRHGSVEGELPGHTVPCCTVWLAGLDRSHDEPEEVPHGHPFPQESASISDLMDQHMADAPDYYVKRWLRTGSLPNAPEIRYDAVFYVEGDRAKRRYNPMIRCQGRTPKNGAYKVQDRYGLWLCRDHFPVQKKNEWVTTKGSEFTRLHAFVNCQDLRLTANRGSVDNTPADILADLESVCRNVYDEITETNEWADMEWLQDQAQGQQSESREERDYKRRADRARNAQVAAYRGAQLISPHQEQGVYALITALLAVDSEALPFEVVDYDTHVGLDALVRTRDEVDIGQTHLRYLELKHALQPSLSHSFKHLYAVACWQCKVGHGGEVEDLRGRKRTLRVTPAGSSRDGYTRYLLDDPQEPRKIEVFVLESYLRERLGVVFGPRLGRTQ